MRRLFLWLAAGLVGLLVLSVLGVAGLYYASQHVPDFYLRAGRVSVEDHRQACDEALTRLAALSSAVRQSGRWQTQFTEDQINGWLAIDLPQNHPQSLPADLDQPRISFSGGLVRIGCRMEIDGLQTVCWAELGVNVTESGELALRIVGAKAGAVPLPIDQLLERLSRAARDGGWALRWAQAAGDPVALVSIPPPQHPQTWRLEAVHLEDGKLLIAGITVTSQESLTDP